MLTDMREPAPAVIEIDLAPLIHSIQKRRGELPADPALIQAPDELPLL